MKKSKIWVSGVAMAVISSSGVVLLDKLNDVVVSKDYKYDNQSELDSKKNSLKNIILSKKENKENAQEMRALCAYDHEAGCDSVVTEIIARRKAGRPLEPKHFGSLNKIVFEKLDPKCPLTSGDSDAFWDSVTNCSQ